MAQHLCIVARDNPLLLGYLNIALAHLRGAGDDLEIVIDRRPPPDSVEAAVPQPAVGVDQRRLVGVDAQLRVRGYAIVSREEGEPWRLAAGADVSPAASRDAESPAAVGKALDFAAYREALRRLPVGSGAVVAAIALAAWVGIPGSAMDQHARAASSVLRASAVAHAPAPTTPAPAAATVPPRVREVVAVAPAPVEPPAPTASERAPARPSAEPAAVLEPAATPAPAAPPREEIAPRAPVALARAEINPKAAAPPARTPARVEIAPKPTVASARAEITSKAPAVTTREAPAKSSVHADKTRPPKEEVVAAPPAPPVEFQGVPRVEMSRERDAAGRTSAILVRLTDQGGRPLSAAEVRVRRLLAGGAVNETRLEATTPEGSYRGRLPAGEPSADGLTMRISIGASRHEVPLAE
jgi:hypothetical protein